MIVSFWFHVPFPVQCVCKYLKFRLVHTVDRENFAVKIISQSRPTTKFLHAKIKLTWQRSMNKLASASPHSPG